MYWISQSAYFWSLKKYDSSRVFSTGRPQSGQHPSLSCSSVQKDSHGVQYQPSYSDL